MISNTLLQKYDIQVQQKNKHVLNTKPYKLRGRVQKKNLVELSDGHNNVETMCKLLCKPVSINITKLSISELNVITKSKSYNDQVQDSLIQEKKHKSIIRKSSRHIRKNRKLTKIKESNSGHDPAMQNVAFPRANKSGIKKMHIQGLVKGMKQPYIKLHRIDETINKAAQISIKTIPNEKCERHIKSEYIGESEVKLNEAASEPLESSILNINKSNITCTKDYPSQSVTDTSHISKTLQAIECAQDQTKSSDNNEIHISYKRKQMSSDSISHCDHVKRPSNIQHVILQETKKLKLNSSEDVRDIYISNKMHSAIEAKCINESKKLNPSAPYDPGDKRNLKSPESADMLQENASGFKEICVEFVKGDNVNSSNEKGNPTIDIISESNSTCVKQDKIESKEIQNPMHRSIPLDKCTVEKYKIYKELRVLLIRVDSFRRILNNNYSAAEIEYVTDAYMKYLMNSNLSNKTRPTSLNCTGLKAQSSPNLAVLKRFRTKDYSCTLYDKVDTKRTQSTIKPSSGALQKLPLMFIKQAKQQRRANIKIPSTYHNLLGHSKGVSEKNSKQNVIRDLNQESVVSPSIIESTLQIITQQCAHKSSELLCTAKGTVGRKQPVGVLNTSLKNNYCSKKRISETLLSKANSMEHINSQIPEELTSSACRSTLTGYCSIISPQKHVKLTDIRDTKGIDYKCIICDQYFTDYSALQQHLTTHTYKQGKSSSDLSKSSMSLSEELQQTTSNLPASEISEFTQLSELKTTDSSGIANNNQQVEKSIITKGQLNTNKIEKKIKSDSLLALNKRHIICSSILSTSSHSAVTELLKAYKLGKQNLVEVEEGKIKNNAPELRTEETVDQNNIANSITHVTEGFPKVVRNEKQLFIQHSVNRVIESPVLSKENFSNIQLISNINLKSQKMKKTVHIRKTFNVCDCHKIARTSKSCLQIEIVLLCRTCKVLFRTMECFEAHYRFPERVACNENRLKSTSPNLFCTSCGMTFSLIQNVRHHLEIHARFNKNCTTEFRCNICKVMFIGVGSLFYSHWSAHAQDPFWIASEQSFPKNSIMISKCTNINKCDEKTTRMSNIFTEGYLQVAEYVCQNCKLPFVTHNDLKEHVTSCNVQYLDKGIINSEKSNLSVQTHLSRLFIEKEVDGFLPIQSQKMDNANKVHSAACSSDKENLIRILEGNDDSEYELQIDLTESFEECDKVSEIEQIQQAIKGSSDADTWIPAVVDNFKSSENIMVNESETNTNGNTRAQDVKDTDISQHVIERPLDIQINAGVSQVSCQNIGKKEELEQLTVQEVENLQSSVVRDTALVRNEEGSSALMVVTPARQQSPQKPMIGYLRVKPLAELTGHTQMYEGYNTSAVSNHGHESLGYNVPLEQFANCSIGTNSSEESSMNLKRKFISLTNLSRPSLSPLNTSTQPQHLVHRQIVESDIAIINEKQRQLRSKVNQNMDLHSQVQNVTQAYFKNSPSYNTFFHRNLPSTVNTTQNNVVGEQYRSTIIKEPSITQDSSMFYQYPYAAATNLSNSNKMPQPIKQKIINNPVAINTPVPNYYNNITVTSGGISMIINQTAPNVQNVSTVNMSQLPVNQQIYEAPVFNASLTAMNTPNTIQPQVYWMWPGK